MISSQMGPDLTFATTALRIAYVFDLNDFGKLVRDLQNGNIYMVKSAGAGVGTMSPLTTTDQMFLPIDITGLRLVTSGNDVGAIAAIGGVGASDTDPIFRGDAAGSLEWSWASGSHVGALGAQVMLPNVCDFTRDVTLELWVYSGTTNAATMAVGTVWDGGTEVTDSASDSATKSATLHKITATIDAADIPDSARLLSLRLTPPTHATDAIQLCGAGLLVYRV